MTSDSFWSCLCAISTMLTGCLFAALLVDDWRFSKERLRIMIPAILLLTALAQVLCFRFLDLNRANLAVTYLDVAVLLLAPALVHWRKGRLLFSMAVAYSFTFSTVFFSHLLFPSFGPENLAVRLISLAVMALFLARRFGPSLRRAFQIEIGGWYGLSLIPLLFAFLFFTQTSGVFRSPVLPPQDSLQLGQLFPSIPEAAVYCVLLVLPPCAYMVFYQFFNSLLRHYAGFRERTVRSAQLSALKAHQDKAQQQRRLDERLLSLLRARLDEVEAQIRQADLPAALSLAEELEARADTVLTSFSRQRYAENPILDAVLGEYAAWTAEHGVALTIRFDLPQRPLLDPAALAVVLSNALENAVRACLDQAEGRPRSIRLFTRNTAEQFFLQIENTCDGPVVFDPATGFPKAMRNGHGYGTRSIAAFARQNGGSLRYEWRDGVFRLQMLI